MSETARIVTHYLEQIVRRAGLKGFEEMRAEIESAQETDATAQNALLVATASLAIATIETVPEYVVYDTQDPECFLYRCAWCRSGRPYTIGTFTGGGHAEDCQRQKTLAALRDVLGQKLRT